MLHYEEKKVDPKKNILYGSTQKEEFILFSSSEDEEYPLRVEMVGITHPDREYFIQREHSDYFVLEYVASGKGYIFDGGKKYAVEEDCVYVLQPGKKHKYGADKKEPYEKIWINFFSDIMTDVFAAYGLSDRTVFPHSHCRKYFDELMEIAQENPVNAKSYLKVSEVIFRLILALAESVEKKREVSPMANRVKEALDSSVYRKITIDKLTEELSVSKSQMTREFKKYYALTPYQYLLDRKIDIAKSLLNITSMKVFEISETLGFTDEYYFSNLFKQKTGESPLAFRFRTKAGQKRAKITKNRKTTEKNEGENQ